MTLIEKICHRSCSEENEVTNSEVGKDLLLKQFVFLFPDEQRKVLESALG